MLNELNLQSDIHQRRKSRLVEPKNRPEQPKKQAENEDIRKRLNALANDYSFSHVYFTEMYEGSIIYLER